MKSEIDNVEEAPLLPESQHRRRYVPARTWISKLVAVLCCLAVLASVSIATLSVWNGHSDHAHGPDVARVQQCSIDKFHEDLSFLVNAKPIEAAEFIERRDRLARALAENGVDAFVLEPGYTFQ